MHLLGAIHALRGQVAAVATPFHSRGHKNFGGRRTKEKLNGLNGYLSSRLKRLPHDPEKMVRIPAGPNYFSI